MSGIAAYSFGDALRMAKGSFFSTPLPANVALDPNSAAAVAELVAQSSKAFMANVNSWTEETVIVPANQPLVPVTCTVTGDSALAAILKLGVPIPPGTVPTYDSDAALCIWQPEWVGQWSGGPLYGRYYELQGVSVVNGQYFCDYGGRMVNVNAGVPGHWFQWITSGQDPSHFATNPDSSYTESTWGAQATGIMYAPGVLTEADVARGYVDHALLLEVSDYRSGAHVWPAMRTDGFLTSSNLVAGQRYRLPAGYPVPQGIHPLQALYIQGWRDYGAVVTDKTAGSGLGVRLAPGCAPALNGTPAWQVMAGAPLKDLQLLKPGTDAAPNPTS